MPDANEVPPEGGETSCDALPAWDAGKTPSTTVYISTTPGPGTPDGSELNPFPRLTAAQPIQPGTRIVLAAGSYPGETLYDVTGTLAAPIWIEGPAAGARATFTGSLGIHLVRAQHVVLRNFDTSATSQAGINVDDGGDATNPGTHHIVVDGVHVDGSDASCFQFSGVTNVTLRNSTGAACRRGVLFVGVHEASIERVTMTTMSVAGVAIAAGSDDIDVRQSWFEDAGTRMIWIGGNSAITEFRPPLVNATGNYEAADVRVFDNVLIGGSAADVAVLCSNCTSSLVAHNLIRGDAFSHVFRVVQEHNALGAFAFVPAGKVRYINNAVEVGGNPFGAQAGSGTDGASCTFANNLWFEVGNPGNSMPNLPTAESNGVYGVPSGHDTAGNLCASAGGAAAGAGLVLPEVPGTREGTCRPAPPSIGPSEVDAGC